MNICDYCITMSENDGRILDSAYCGFPMGHGGAHGAWYGMAAA